MKIYNAQKNIYQEFIPIDQNEVKIYVCGPTVYNDIHIGNARPIIFFDVVHRYLTELGYNVSYVSNVTDVDDKIIKRALELDISEHELTEQTKQEYYRILADLNVLPYMAIPEVTKYMQQIIAFIVKLVELDFAYVVNGDVYFRVNKIKEYGEVSNRDLAELQAGVRIDINPNKEYDADFTLWKKTQEGVSWDSPFSKGRPGWHTECVVMIRDILGETIDIHGGGQDLKFPHHENENAQSLACNRHLANYWMHNGFINLGDEKMSKSLGNVLLVKDILDQYGANFLRLLLLQTNYRQPIVIKQEFIAHTENITQRFQAKYDKITLKAIDVKNNLHIDQINEYMENDFNTANVISYLLSLGKNDDTVEVQNAYLYAFKILGLEFKTQLEEIPVEVLELVEARKIAKHNKDFNYADDVRKKINALGYDVLDTREGVICQKIR